MSNTPWAYTTASAIGTSHQRRNEGCQDYSLATCFSSSERSDRRILFAAVADGAGTAKFAAEGAKLAVRFLLDEIRRSLFKNDLHLTKNALQSAALQTSTRIEENAIRKGNSVRDYASTLICVVLLPDQAWHLQIGDGAAVFRYGENRIVEFWPDKGAYGNETFFITDEYMQKHLHIRNLDLPDEVTLFTDGLETIALDLTNKKVHNPFFESFYRVLCQREPGFQRDLAAALEKWMQTDLVINRTDDDKSLVLVSKARMPEPPIGD